MHDDIRMDEAVQNLRALILAGERYRQVVAGVIGLGTTESQAISYLALHGERGQSDLARDLVLTSSAATALVDRLERHGVAERFRHHSDRRRILVRLTAEGQRLVEQGQLPLQASLRRIDPDALPTVSSWLAAIADHLLCRSRPAAEEELAAAVEAVAAGA